MAKVRILYWKEIPAQLQASDPSGTVSQPLPDRFQAGIDAVAMFDGSRGTDDYLMAWEWGDEMEVEGTAEEAASWWAKEIENRFPQDFVARIEKLHDSGKRDPRPGTVNHWMEEEVS